METIRNQSMFAMVIGGMLTCCFGGCMMMGMMGHESNGGGTEANAPMTRVVKESIDHNLTLSAEFSSANVNKPVRYAAFLTETASGTPLSGARIRLYVMSAESGHAVYSCPMHPEVVTDKPGTCPKCGMKLKKTQQLEGGAEVANISQARDSSEMEETATAGVYATRYMYSLEGTYTVLFSLTSIGDRKLDPPIVLTSTQEILADHGSHGGGMHMSMTTMIAIGAVAMALMMAFSWGRWL